MCLKCIKLIIVLLQIFERGGESSGKPSSGPYTALLSGGSSSRSVGVMNITVKEEGIELLRSFK